VARVVWPDAPAGTQVFKRQFAAIINTRGCWQSAAAAHTSQSMPSKLEIRPFGLPSCASSGVINKSNGLQGDGGGVVVLRWKGSSGAAQFVMPPLKPPVALNPAQHTTLAKHEFRWVQFHVQLSFALFCFWPPHMHISWRLVLSFLSFSHPFAIFHLHFSTRDNGLLSLSFRLDHSHEESGEYSGAQSVTMSATLFSNSRI